MGGFLSRFRRSSLQANPKTEIARLSKDQRRKILEERSEAERKPVYATGTGRCGTHFLQRLMSCDPLLDARHMPAPEVDSFTRYCLWHGLAIDHGGFWSVRRSMLAEAAAEFQVYFESNPYLTFSIWELHARLGAGVILLLRNALDVVNSHYVKGWYESPCFVDDPLLPQGYQAGMPPHYVFGRITPHGEDFERWQGLTRIGKISWMWSTVNLHAYDLLQNIPEQSRLLLRIEELDFKRYLELHSFVGGYCPVSRDMFDAIKKERPGRGESYRSKQSWTAREIAEFEIETVEARRRLGYE